MLPVSGLSMYPNRSSRVRMSFFRKCLALSAFVAVLTACGTAPEQVTTELPDDQLTATIALQSSSLEPMFATAQIRADAWDAAVEARMWSDAVNAALAEQERQREAAEAAARPRARTPATSSGSGTYHGNPSGSVNGYPCGGDLPSCHILERESGGDPTAENPVSSASGLWQFIDGTWNGFGGYSHAADAPPEVQNEKARQTWAGGAGCRHWSMTASGC